MEWLERVSPLIAIDAMTEWITVIAPVLVFCVVVLGSFRFLIYMGRAVRHGSNGATMSKSQVRAEREAIRKLNTARKMLKQSSGNLQEAQRIRLDVTNQLLPSNNMYIVGEHPKSLLRDVDKRIRRAVLEQLIAGRGDVTSMETIPSQIVPSRTFPSQTVPLQTAPSQVVSSQTISQQKPTHSITERYRKASQQNQGNSYWAFAVLLLAAVILIAVLVGIGQHVGSGSMTNSFSWINQ